jgi:hypothetical protein
VLYPAEGADRSQFDEREEGYVKVEVPMSQIEAVGWQRLPETGHFWIYVPVRSVAQGGQGVPAKDCLNRMSNTHYCSLTLMSSLKGDWNMVKNSHVKLLKRLMAGAAFG